MLVYFRNKNLKISIHVPTPYPLLNTNHTIEKKLLLIVSRHKFYQNLACDAHFNFSNHDLFKRLFENCCLKIVSSFSSFQIVSIFSFLTLHAANFLLWGNISTVSRTTTFRIFLMGRSECSTKLGSWGRGGGGRGRFLCKPKSLNFLLVMRIPHTWKISISFSISFNKNFACSIYSVTQLWLIWKSSIKIKSPLKTSQCPARLSPRIICQVSPFLTKMSKNCCTNQAWTVPFTWTFTGNSVDGAKSYPAPKNVLIFRIRKMSRLKVSFPPHQIAIFNHPVQHSFVTAVISVASYSKFQDLYTHMSC